MSTGPKRHHLVSRGYLKAWRPDGEQQRVRVRVLPALEPKLIGVNDICVKPYWLAVTDDDGERDVTIEEQLGILESRAIPRLRDALDVGFVRAEERITVAYLLTSLAVRGTTLRADLRTEGIAAGERYLLDHPDAAEEAIRWEQKQHETGDLALLTTFELIAPHHAAWFASMHWALYRDPRAGFVTADQPLVHVLDAHTGDPKTSPTPLFQGSLDAIMIALSPSILLVGSWQPGPDTPTQVAPIELPAWFNQRVQEQADRHLIYPPTATPRASRRVCFPRLDLRHHARRLDAAIEARSATSDLDDAAGMVFVRCVDGEYRLHTTKMPTDV